MSGSWIEPLGWVATAVFVGSYFCSQPQRLRLVQMLGALLWIVYGAVMGALPVVVCNVLVLGAAGWTVVSRVTARRSRVQSSSSTDPGGQDMFV